jgi:pSer/pThr/pTyr-binding forkhead associated (FHA) protein
VKLVIEDEAGTRSIVPFESDEITVGRAAEGVTFRLSERNVSRRHARFVRANGAIFVEDLGSLTGTLVNGERVSGRRRVREGDLVEIGEYDLAVLGEVNAIGPGAPPPLPPGGRATPDPRAVAELPPPPPAPATRSTAPRRSTFWRAVVVGVLALALGAVAGFAAGALTAPPPPTTAPAGR